MRQEIHHTIKAEPDSNLAGLLDEELEMQRVGLGRGLGGTRLAFSLGNSSCFGNTIGPTATRGYCHCTAPPRLRLLLRKAAGEPSDGHVPARLRPRVRVGMF